MLAYLDLLCNALIARNDIEARRLLAHPLARQLPRRVREEALSMTRGRLESRRAPLQMMRFRHQMAQLLLEEPDPAGSASQLELPLPMLPEPYEISTTIVRAARLTPKRRVSGGS